MRLILSRKGFDSASGGCPSPIFPDGTMIALPIPDKRSSVRYGDLTWRERNLGELVTTLTRGRQRSDYGAHLDPDLRPEMRTREAGWRPSLGQLGAAQGHLRKQKVTVGDLFLFWGVFREVDDRLRWLGPAKHYIWGWLQIGAVAPVDAVVRNGGEQWRWAMAHPHWAFPPNPTNTLYVASEQLSLPGGGPVALAGSGVFESANEGRRLTADNAKGASQWSLPGGFLPEGRQALSYHESPGRWSRSGNRAQLLAVARGQEFVLDLDLYPDLIEWIANVITGSQPCLNSSGTR